MVCCACVCVCVCVCVCLCVCVHPSLPPFLPPSLPRSLAPSLPRSLHLPPWHFSRCPTLSTHPLPKYQRLGGGLLCHCGEKHVRSSWQPKVVVQKWLYNSGCAPPSPLPVSLTFTPSSFPLFHFSSTIAHPLVSPSALPSRQNVFSYHRMCSLTTECVLSQGQARSEGRFGRGGDERGRGTAWGGDGSGRYNDEGGGLRRVGSQAISLFLGKLPLR